MGPKSRFLAKKSDFSHTTPILVYSPFVALGVTVHKFPSPSLICLIFPAKVKDHQRPDSTQTTIVYFLQFPPSSSPLPPFSLASPAPVLLERWLQGKPLEKLSSNWSRRDEEYIGIMQKKADLFFFKKKVGNIRSTFFCMILIYSSSLLLQFDESFS